MKNVPYEAPEIRYLMCVLTFQTYFSGTGVSFLGVWAEFIFRALPHFFGQNSKFAPVKAKRRNSKMPTFQERQKKET